MFLFRRSKVVVDTFIATESIYNFYKIDYANKFLPQGWKSMQAQTEQFVAPGSKIKIPIPTIKRCVGLNNLFSTGFMLPSWSDLKFEMPHDGMAHVFDPANIGQQGLTFHPEFLWWEDLYKGYGHIKITSPWLIKEKSGINFLWHQCDWNNTERIADFHVLSGIVDYRFQNNSHINVFMKRGSIVEINAGDPLVHIVPLTDKKVELRNHLVGEMEYNRILRAYTYKSMFIGQHRSMIKASEESKPKCPFGFGKK